MGNTSSSGGSGIVGNAVVAFLIGFLIYRDMTSALYFTLYATGAAFATLTGVVPVFGTIATSVIIVYLQGWVLQFIDMSWGITAVYWLYMAFAVICGVVVLVFIGGALADRR
jgi:hypothetical protein